MKSFAHCSNLVSVIIEQDGKSYGLHRIGAFAFWRCVSLENINLKDADHLSMIGRGAFEGRESLDHIKLPDHFYRLDVFAFRGCVNLRRCFDSRPIVTE